MKKVIFILGMLAITFTTSFAQTPAAAPDPGITVFMYRKVSDDKRAEFIKRETTYWAEVAKKSLAKGNITFWALLEKGIVSPHEAFMKSIDKSRFKPFLSGEEEALANAAGGIRDDERRPPGNWWPFRA